MIRTVSAMDEMRPRVILKWIKHYWKKYNKYNFYFSDGHLGFETFTRCFNNSSDISNAKLDRRLFERMLLIYALIEYQLFMGEEPKLQNECCAFLPKNVYVDLDKFIIDNYDIFYKQFVSFWSNHSSFHPCQQTKRGDKCSAALVCDGNLKIRRRLCSNLKLPLEIPEHFDPLFKDSIVGCSHTPVDHSELCKRCEESGVQVDSSSKSAKRKPQKTPKNKTNDLATVSTA